MYLPSVHEMRFQEFYPEGHYIIKQDTLGDKFYILSEGQVKVTKTNKGELTTRRL